MLRPNPRFSRDRHTFGFPNQLDVRNGNHNQIIVPVFRKFLGSKELRELFMKEIKMVDTHTISSASKSLIRKAFTLSDYLDRYRRVPPHRLVSHFRFVPAIARPASVKAFMFWIAACSTTCSSKQSFASLSARTRRKVRP